jgi:transposase-like protein
LREWNYEKQPKYSPEVIERAVRMVSEAGSQYESQWAAITSIAAKIGCTPETLRRWVRQQELLAERRPNDVIRLRATTERSRRSSGLRAKLAVHP